MILLELKKKSSIRDMRGFTLIEMLITMAIVGMMMSAIYAVHIANIRAVDVEEERVEIQQDQRISLDFITRQLRMAGYNKAESPFPKIEDARSNFIYFTSDFNDDGDVDDDGEHIAFCVFNSTEGRALSYITGNNNGVGAIGTAVATPGGVPIGHTHTGHDHQAFAPIEDIEFYYSYLDSITNTMQKTTEPTAGQLDSIRSVEVTILSRADTPDPRWTDTRVYVPASEDAFNDGNPYGDTTRRRMMTANVRFRNLGL
jgi:type IV pilus assembly protein PilW